jgi:hypothetical protein
MWWGTVGEADVSEVQEEAVDVDEDGSDEQDKVNKQ